MGIPEAQLQSIATQVVKLETLQEVNTRALTDMAGSVNRLVERLEMSDDTARDADQRSRSAHKRIEELRQEIERMKQSQKWIITTSFGLIGLAVSLLGLAVKFIQ